MSQQVKIDLIDVSSLSAEDGVRKLIEAAVELRVSDLMYACNEQTIAVQVRHLGQMRNLSALEPGLGKRHLQHIKAQSGIDISEHRRPQDGRWVYQSEEGHTVDLRINIVPTLHGEDFSIRLLDRTAGQFSLEELGMHEQQLRDYIGAIDNVGGMILVTGPTGSGKSSTLYATIRRLNDGLKKINTIEDPVEFSLDGVRQSQANSSIGLGFPELLRGVLRQAPDIVMIGEIRDPETAQTAVQAANSGMLVLATLHAPTPAAGIQSLRSLGVNPHFLASSMRCIVGQRLIRTLCPKCKSSFDLDEAALAFDDVRQWLKPGEGKKIYSAKGCDDCRGIGYNALSGVFEVMAMSNELRNMISDGKGSADLRDQAIKEGMIEFRQAALLRVARGETSTEEVFRVIPSEHLLAAA